MVSYKFSLTVKAKNTPSPATPIFLNLEDKIVGHFSLDVNNSIIPDDYNGCDSAINFNFSGKSIISGTEFILSTFCVNQRILTSVLFSDGMEYLLKLNFDKQTFELTGSDIVPFTYSGEITHFHVETHFNFLLNITQMIIPPSDPSVNLKIGDKLSGEYYVDAGAVPKGYSGPDSCKPYGFEGKTTICNTVYQLRHFSVENVHKITSLTFVGDISYILKLDLVLNVFDLFGDDIVRFHYRGKLTASQVPSAPTGLKIK